VLLERKAERYRDMRYEVARKVAQWGTVCSRYSLHLPLLLRRQKLQVDLGGLDTGVSQALLQIVERPARLEPLHGVQMAQVMEAEAPELRVLPGEIPGSGR
jgi:hypothetical protein